MDQVHFRKMQGAGNDFVVVDARARDFSPSPAQARWIADRHLGVGCDQLIVLDPPQKDGDLFMRVLNADGSASEACGNATRCVASLIFAEKNSASAKIETLGGLLLGSPASNKQVTIDMGAPRLGWKDIPLAREMETLKLDFSAGPFSGPCAINMGNPHLVFFVEAMPDEETIRHWGPIIEHDPLVPQRANVAFVEVRTKAEARARVWERGAGLTLACGSGACAIMVAAVRREKTDRQITLHLDGGTLEMEWRANDDHVLMTGPWALSYEGRFVMPENEHV